MDELLKLAYSVYSSKGIYALLLGSGISHSAKIPTGWEIVLDLITKIAKIKGEDCENDPYKWYKKNYNKEPNYSEILNELASTNSERQLLLKKYFEPTNEERENGIKVPTPAHKAIADMVKNGYVKVIITTNFDRLLETALINIGINPTVISNKDSLHGAIPIVHAPCTIIKVHGDYMDTRIKNTVEELSQYDDDINQLLDRVLDEYGLIISGWSAEWDIALDNCFKRCKGHRFSTYWTYIDKLSTKANDIINIRQAKVIKIKDADNFFNTLNEKIEALNDIYTPSPLSVNVAIATTKKYLSNKDYKIHLHDLVVNEIKNVKDNISKIDNTANNQDIDSIRKQLHEYESCMKILLNIFAYGCYWSDNSNFDLWKNCIQSMYSLSKNGCILNKYPALLLLYCGGISCFASNNFQCLHSIMVEPQAKNYHRNLEPILCNIIPNSIFNDKSTTEDILQKENRFTPTSDYLYDSLKNIFNDLILTDDEYDTIFDKFEYFYSLVYIDTYYKDPNTTNQNWAPTGRYAWKSVKGLGNIIDIVENDFNKEKDNWDPFIAGFFKKDKDRYIKITDILTTFLHNISSSFF